MRLPAIPMIECEQSFDTLVQRLSVFFVQAIDAPLEWEELRRDVYPTLLKPLVQYLVDDVTHPEIVCALLALRWHFGVLEDEDDRGVNETRALACELVAWRFVTRLTRRETIECLCHDLPPADGKKPAQGDVESGLADADENSPLLGNAPPEMDESFYDEFPRQADYAKQSNFATIFAGLNVLEIAAVAEAKKFLAQKSVQHIIDGIWTGDIVFWETLSTHSTKQAKAYRKDQSDPFCRLRVPLYLKVLEVVFFAAFLAFYYAVLVQRPTDHITLPEVMLYVWLVSFTYNEFVEFMDAGSTFYATDFWALWDVGIIIVGLAFFVTRMIGLANNDRYATDVAFDILSVEALFLVPRICSPLSLHPYFGMLLPVLKEMTKDFLKFAVLVVVAYTGFSSCFSVLGRDHYSFGSMNWILVKVFFGSSYLGFDVAEEISPTLGPPLMFIFIAMTNFLLLTVLISLLSNKLDKVMTHARDEYLMVYSIYVLEASTSNRLTYFVPPLNLLPLLLRPLRLVVSHQQLRMLRIRILKVTHLPIVGLILGWENGRLWLQTDRPSAEKLGGSKRLSKRLSRKAVGCPPSLARETPAAAGRPPVRDDASAPETIGELGAAVNDLRKHVDLLTQLLLAPKQTEVAESS